MQGTLLYPIYLPRGVLVVQLLPRAAKLGLFDVANVRCRSGGAQKYVPMVCILGLWRKAYF